jgi:site-specific recombinase XerD
MPKTSAADRRWGNNPGDGLIVPPAEAMPDLAGKPEEFRQAWSAYAGLIDAWLADLARRAVRGERATATLQQYRRLVRGWTAWLIERGCAAPTARDARRFLAWGAKQGWRDHTVHAYRATLRSLYAWAAGGGKAADITATIRCRPNPLPVAAPGLSAGLVTACIRAIAGRTLQAYRDRAIIAVLYAGALEPISLHRARRGDLRLRRGILVHQPRGHRGADAEVRLDRQAKQLLDRYLRRLPRAGRDSPLFPALAHDRTTVTGRPLSTLSLRLLVRRTIDHVLGAAPAVAGPLRRRGRTPQRAASRALRRSALVSAAGRHGLDHAMAMVQATPRKRWRFAATLQALHPVG